MNKFFLAAILANTAVLLWGLIDHSVEHALEPLHTLFLLVFVGEIGWRLGRGERGGWIAFDTLIVALSLLPTVGAGVTVLRIARTARVAHALRHAAHLRHISALRLLDVFRTNPATEKEALNAHR